MLMSCNQPLYEKEEDACRETFLRNAEGADIPYYFYRGDGKAYILDNQRHILYLPTPDNLAGTSRKTVEALKAALTLNQDWDYLVKTNVSTWIDIDKLVEMSDSLEGREDLNIYGSRFLVNEASKNVPFPRGNFVILSRSLVEGIVRCAPMLIAAEGYPKTDDTLISLSLVYHIQKACGDNYVNRLRETPSVASWTDDITEALGWTDAISIRCKDETDKETTPDHMREVDKLRREPATTKRKYHRQATNFETKYGYIPYLTYEKTRLIINKLVEKVRQFQSSGGTTEEK